MLVDLVQEFGIVHGVLLAVIGAQFLALHFLFGLLRASVKDREQSADEKLALTNKLARVALIAGSAGDMPSDRLRAEIDGIIKE